MTLRESVENPERAKDKRSVWGEVTRKSAAESAIAADEGSEVEHGTRFFNRELSALEYNARLLACAEDVRRPALDRARFLAIVSRNLDEFFQIRVSGLREQADAGVTGASPDGLSPRQQLDAIRARAHPRSNLASKWRLPGAAISSTWATLGVDWRGRIGEAETRAYGMNEFERW